MRKISGVSGVLQECSTSTKRNPTAYGASNDGVWYESRVIFDRSSFIGHVWEPEEQLDGERKIRYLIPHLFDYHIAIG